MNPTDTLAPIALQVLLALGLLLLVVELVAARRRAVRRRADAWRVALAALTRLAAPRDEKPTDPPPR